MNDRRPAPARKRRPAPLRLALRCEAPAWKRLPERRALILRAFEAALAAPPSAPKAGAEVSMLDRKSVV
jgi:hypothetical protein